MILITTHTNADFDALASMVAALRLYPGAMAAFSGAAESLVRRFLDGYGERIPPIHSPKTVPLDEVERLVCVDVSSRERIGPLEALLDRTPPIPMDVFDHHPGMGDLAGERHEVMEAGACTTVMIQSLVDAGCTPVPFEASLFLIAIYEDTGFLTFPTTRPADFEGVIRCLEWGGDLGLVPKVLKRGFTEEQMRLLAGIFENLEMIPVGGVPIHVSTLSSDHYVPDLSLLVHEILAMEGLECLFLLAYMENRVHVIARSGTPMVDVGNVLGFFGGGGHASAASAVIRGKTLSEVKALLVDELTTRHPVGMKASDIMTRTFHRIGSDANVRGAFRDMNRCRVNALPVFHETRLVGVITRQEIDGAHHHGLGDAPITDFVVRVPPLFPADTPVEEVRRQMLEHNWRIILFGDSYDEVEGLISRMNLFKTLYRRDQVAVRARAGGQPSSREVQHLLKAAFPPEEMAMLKKLGAMAAEAGSPCLLVGGAVRDLLLGRPIRDVDFVVEGNALELAETWAKTEGGRVRAHRAFETAVWVRPDGSHWDFATARAEYYETPAALPTVAHAALYQDLYRRDFTLNTLALHLAPECFGEILDLFGGVRDLKSGRIRVLHGLSFLEDPTRAFRAVRFAVRLAFSLPPETENLIASTLKQGAFGRLSPKRVLAEVNLILSGANAVEGLRLMENHGLLRVFWPSLKLTPKVLEMLYRIQQALGFYETQFPEEPVDKPCVYFMALTQRLSTAELKEFRDHYPFSQATREVLATYRSVTWHVLKRMGGKERCNAGCVYGLLKGKPTSLALFLLAKIRPAAKQRVIRDYITRDRFATLRISGRDLIEAGIPPSPAISRALGATLEAKVDGALKTRKAELAYALAEARKATKENK